MWIYKKDCLLPELMILKSVSRVSYGNFETLLSILVLIL